jgi:hypothetical protein
MLALIACFLFVHPVFADGAAATFPSAAENALFRDLRQKLDYDDRAVAAAIPSTESDLLERAKESPRTALYAALYMTNASYAAREGLVPFSRLVSRRRFSPSPALNDELFARQLKIVELFKAASAGLGGDPRMPGWLASGELKLEMFRDGHPDPGTLERLVKAAVDYPAFNLFSALLSENGALGFQFAAPDEERLFELARELVTSPKACQGDRVCGNTPKAPFNLQSSVAILGDAIFKKANALLGSAKPAEVGEGLRLAYLTRGVYQSVLNGKKKEDTRRWPGAPALETRIDLVTTAIQRRVPADGAFWRSYPARRAYQCASCHSGEYRP